MKKIFLIISLFLSISSFSQSSLFDNFFIFGDIEEREFCDALTVDASGNTYSCGLFRETVDFDPSSVNFPLSSPSATSSYIAKYGPNNNLISAKRFQCFSSRFFDIKVDSDGNILLAGFFQGTLDFDPGAAVLNLTSVNPNNGDVFVLKLDSNFNLIWIKTMGSGGRETATALAIDSQNNILVTGTYQTNLDLDPSTSVFNVNGTNDATDTNTFICKLSSNGNFVWGKSIARAGIVDFVKPTDIKTDTNNSIVIVGNFKGSADFDPGNGVVNLVTTNSSDDAFILKLDGNGNFNWIRKFNTTNPISLSGISSQNIVINTANEIYASFYCSTSGSIDFDPGPGTFISNVQGSSGFTTTVKFDTIGNFITAKILESPPLAIRPDGLALDVNQNIVLTGKMSGTTNFGTVANPVIFSSINTSPNNYYYSFFILRVTPQLTFLDYKKIDSFGPDAIISNNQNIAIDSNNKLHASFEVAGNITMGQTGGTNNMYQNGLFINVVYLHDQLSNSLSTSELSKCKIAIYPNPSSTFLNIDFEENANLQIIDMLGKIIFESKLENGTNTLDIGFLKNGIYVTKIQNEKGIYNQKIIKE